MNTQVAKVQFAQFDADKDGKIGKSELVVALGQFAKQMETLDFKQEDVDAEMKKLDTDGSNDLDFAEFCTLVKKLTLDQVSKEGWPFSSIYGAADPIHSLNRCISSTRLTKWRPTIASSTKRSSRPRTRRIFRYI